MEKSDNNFLHTISVILKVKDLEKCEIQKETLLYLEVFDHEIKEENNE